MTEVNDEATNALIASMLAEDNHYTEYDAYNMAPDSEDDDWGGSKRKPKKGVQKFTAMLCCDSACSDPHAVELLIKHK